MTINVLRRLFTVKEFHRMIETGILKEGDPVELVRGEIIQMAAIGSKHASCVRRVSAVLRSRLGDAVFVDTQNPIELGEYSEPQPNVALLRPRADFYAEAHPKSEDVFLLVEVSDTTLRFDRSVKIPLYAEEGIAEVWIVNLSDESVEVYRSPSPTGYESVQTFSRGQSIEGLAFPKVSIAVDELLG